MCLEQSNEWHKLLCVRIYSVTISSPSHMQNIPLPNVHRVPLSLYKRAPPSDNNRSGNVCASVCACVCVCMYIIPAIHAVAILHRGSSAQVSSVRQTALLWFPSRNVDQPCERVRSNIQHTHTPHRRCRLMPNAPIRPLPLRAMRSGAHDISVHERTQPPTNTAIRCACSVCVFVYSGANNGRD